PILFAYFCHAHHRHILSFPTRRSSDLLTVAPATGATQQEPDHKNMKTNASSHANLNDFFAERVEKFADKPALTCLGHTLSYRERSEEHTSELQSRQNILCRLLLEKNKD